MPAAPCSRAKVTAACEQCLDESRSTGGLRHHEAGHRPAAGQVVAVRARRRDERRGCQAYELLQRRDRAPADRLAVVVRHQPGSYVPATPARGGRRGSVSVGRASQSSRGHPEDLAPARSPGHPVSASPVRRPPTGRRRPGAPRWPCPMVRRAGTGRPAPGRRQVRDVSAVRPGAARSASRSTRRARPRARRGAPGRSAGHRPRPAVDGVGGDHLEAVRGRGRQLEAADAVGLQAGHPHERARLRPVERHGGQRDGRPSRSTGRPSPPSSRVTTSSGPAPAEHPTRPGERQIERHRAPHRHPSRRRTRARSGCPGRRPQRARRRGRPW